MKKIKFEGTFKLNEKETVENPEVSLYQTIDMHEQSICAVHVKMKSNGYSLIKDIGILKYTDTWTDSDLLTHIDTFMASKKV